jgi:hypothetical protein
MSDEAASIFEPYTRDFAECPPLGDRVLHVLQSLPEPVQRDFLDDPRFRVTVEQYVEGRGWTVFMNVPGELGSGSRSVVLRPRLATSSEEYAHWVIAHEFAHAFLRHGDGGDTTHLERDADALAAEWGFARPETRE